MPFFATIAAAVTCPTTVAIAAPEIPIASNPIQPKIKTGSSAMLTTAPTICAIIGVFISPSACKILVQMLSKNKPKLNTLTILP